MKEESYIRNVKYFLEELYYAGGNGKDAFPISSA